MDRKRRAFTLVELLIVISVMGLLATLILVGLRAARLKANDVQVKSDVSALNRALVAFAAEHGEKYPVSNANSLDSACGLWTNFGYTCSTEGLTNSSPTGQKLVSGNYLKSIPTTKNGGYSYRSNGKTFSVWGQLASSPKNYTYSTTDSSPDPKVSEKSLTTAAMFSGMPSGVGSVILYPVWRDDQRALWISSTSVNAGKVSVDKIEWSSAYAVNPPIRYKVFYKKSSSSTWLEGTSYGYGLSAKINAELDIADTYDFKVVAIDEGNIDSSSGNNPILMNVDFNETTVPIGPGGSSVKFYVCTKGGVGQGSPCNADPPSRPDLVYVKVDSILDPDQIDGITVNYKPTSSTDWGTYSSPNVPDGGPTSPVAIISLRKDTYDFRVFSRLKNGLVNQLNYFSGSAQGTITMPDGASTKADFEFPFFIGDTLNIALSSGGSGRYTAQWQPAFDNIGVEKYHVKLLDGSNTLVDSYQFMPGMNIDGLTKGKTYKFMISAFDEAGNESITVPKDVAAP